MKKNDLALYQKYHLDRDDERLEMFAACGEHFAIESILYPGCFVHVTPSFVFPKATYVDMDKRAQRFFASPSLASCIAKRKAYPRKPQIQFHHQNYTQPLPETDQTFDLLISQYGGFVSQHCKRYLKIGGWLLTNNSHGDASMAFIDDDYELVAVIKRRGNKFQLSQKNLETYFIPKKEISISKAYLQKIQRGIGYQKSAFSYVFKRKK